MDSIWNILGLEPTREKSAIKRAYAKKTQSCHPEDDPEGFMRLRDAYQAAMDYAQGNEDVPMEQGASDADEAPAEAGWTMEEPEDGPNPFEDSEAIRQFLELYTGKQRKDGKRWLDYFTSAAFLDAAREPQFTRLLLEHVNRLEGEYPVNREFLNWFCVAYQFVGKKLVYRNPDGSDRVEFEFQIYQGAEFDGLGDVFEIAKKGPLPKPPRGNELGVLNSFLEYRYLAALAEAGDWGEEAVGAYSEIIGRYAAAYITDNCQQRRDMDYERHPAGLRMMVHFFERYELPDELYRIAWQKLDLKTALMGRAKSLYGSLRERALERLPDIGEEKRESFAKLKTETIPYFAGCYQRAGSDPQKDMEETDALFAREDFQRALLNRRFVEEEMLHTWVSDHRCDYYLQRVIDFYEAHPAAPCAQRIIDRAKEMLRARENAARLQEEQAEDASEAAMTLSGRAFFRHWINTGFYQARDPESGQYLMGWLNQELPYLDEWSRRFLNLEGDCIPEPKTLTCALGEDRVEVRFHLRYIDFLLNGALVCRPCLEWDRVAALEDTDTFFFLLPITVAAYNRFEEVKGELLRRLEDTATPEEGRAVIAACLAGQVCSLPLTRVLRPLEEDELPENGNPCTENDGRRWELLPPEAALPFELFAEDAEHLYGCAWSQQYRVLDLFQQTRYGRQFVGDEPYEKVPDGETAAALANQLLDETINPRGLALEELVNLPAEVYSEPDFLAVYRDSSRWGEDMPRALLGEDVTREALETLLWLFAGGRINRLELSWPCAIPVGEEQEHEPRRSLVFLKGGDKFACLYFDDFGAQSYALLARPELFGKDKGRGFKSVPFRQSSLSGEVIHRGFSTIQRQLPTVFSQVSWPNNVKFLAGGIWYYAAIVTHGRHKYNLDKQLLGGFSEERAHNNEDARFYFYTYPDTAVWTDGEGNVETLAVNELNRSSLQKVMLQFLGGAWPKLRLTWGSEAEKRRHIVLLHESGRFLLVWVDEAKRQVEFHVADHGTYLDVEGKKYPKDTFRGRTVGAYIIHDGAAALRNPLELLLANMDEPSRIINKFAEYAGEKPVKARPYEALWDDLVGDTDGAE